MEAKIRNLIEGNFNRLTRIKVRVGKVTPDTLNELDHYVRALWDVGAINGDEWQTYLDESNEWLKEQLKKQEA